MPNHSCRDRLEQALIRIADPTGEGGRAVLRSMRIKPAPQQMPPMHGLRAARRSVRSMASS